MSEKREALLPESAEGAVVKSPTGVRARRVAIRSIYGLLSLWTLAMSMGLVAVLSGSVPDGPFAFLAATTTAWKLLSLGGYLVITWTGGRSVVAAQWVLVGQSTWLLAELIAPQDASEGIPVVVARYAVNTLIFLGPWIVLAPERRQLLHVRARPDRVASAIVAVYVPVLIVWALSNAGLGFPVVDGLDPAEARFDATGLALVLGTVGAFAALRPSGRRWPLGVVSAGALYVGLCVLVTDPADLASPGVLGGLALVVLGVLLAWRAHQPVER